MSAEALKERAKERCANTRISGTLENPPFFPRLTLPSCCVYTVAYTMVFWSWEGPSFA